MEIVQIDIDEEPREPNEMMDPSLYEFVKLDSIVSFKSCVRKRSAKELHTPCGNTLLHVAVSYGSDNITSYLAETFPSLITTQNSQKDTILHLAAREGKSHEQPLLEVAKEIASEVQSESKWKQLGELAMSNGRLEMAEECMRHATDLSGLLLLYSSLGNSEGISKLGSLAKEQGKINVAFLCLFMLGKVEDCLQLLVEGNRIPEAALMARSYLPSKVSEIVAIWRKDLNKFWNQPQISTNTKGNTPLHDAVIKGNRDLAIFLASKDPEVAYYNNKNGRSPLYLSVEKGKKNGILDDLLKLGASIPIKREDGDALPKGKSPVHAAIERRDKDILEKIEKAKPELLCLTDEELGNSLHYASSIAAENGKDRVVRYILRQEKTLVESLVNEMDEDGNTPLHLATHRGQSVAAFVLVRDKRVDNSIVNNENLTPYDIAEQQSKIAVEQYEKTDEMLAEDRKLFYSKNSNPAKEKEVESKKQGTRKPSPKEYKLLDYYGAMTTSSILYFYALPTKSIYEHFTSTDQCKTPRKQETKSRIQNLLVVAVLVAGVTFSGAIQMPQLRSNNNSGEHPREFNSTATASRNNTAFDSPTGSSLLDGYLCLDVWALNTSVVAATILLWTNLNDVKFAPFAVWFSSLMVGGSIYMMCLSFFFAVSIALGGSNYGVFAIIVIVVAVVFFLAQTLLSIQWILPPTVNQILEGLLSHHVYYISFFLLVYIWRWLTDKIPDLRRKKN
ncbi:hypothetical protein DKX38_020200 [Salix brachista]|uniref:PGG domain-containing protein n=1 Tax=Salix brachista TaxID=2182728 RepID=A0A5N5KID4_9ROSI|nr:hypothetical protein DKX38_020200 [Salix brachista]